MFDAETKDLILSQLAGLKKPIIITSSTFPYDFGEVKMLFRQFEERKLITTAPFSSGRLRVEMETLAHDFIQRGGFKFEEEIFQNNFTKLELELAKLEREHPSVNFDSVTKALGALGAVAGISGALGDKI